MATDTDGTPTPQKVVELATERAKLDRTALIGTFGSTLAPGALIRLPSGGFEKVAVGDDLAGGTVMAIGEDRVVVSRMGSDLVLTLPQG